MTQNNRAPIDMNVLVIDDSEMVADMMSEILSDAGYAVDVASDGDQGVESFKENHHDLIITDILLPKKSGLRVIEEIRGENEVVKIIAMSGTVRGTCNIEDILNAGANQFFDKSSNIEEIVGTVTQLLQNTDPTPAVKLIED